ncbi:hypothetical protein ABZV29_02830 [Streptomyces sp. NPDC005236]|uniref:hypothetical protein n=1 Tax=Streptomyces sp. NPDC005236 TaxID=3157028 RepID=UPI0033A7BF53
MAEYEGVDALLAAITDAELPEGARDDVVFMAEHRSAVADVDVLREQLVVIGNALADSGRPAESARASQKSQKSQKPKGAKRSRASRRSGDGRPEGSPKKRSRHRGALAAGVGALAAAAVASMVVGLGWMVAHDGTGAAKESSSDAKADSGSGSESSLSAPGYIACSRLLVEGTVTAVAAVPGTAQDRITLDVYHYYKPATGGKKVTFLMSRDVDPRLRRGDEVLVGIQRHASTPDIWSVGEEQIARDRSWIVKALPESRDTRCAQ